MMISGCDVLIRLLLATLDHQPVPERTRLPAVCDGGGQTGWSVLEKNGLLN